MFFKTGMGLLLLSAVAMAKVTASYSIGYVGMSMDYREYNNGSILDSEKSSFGDLQGYELEYAYKMQENGSSEYSTIVFSVLYLNGDTEYVGAYLGSSAGYGSVVSTTSNDIIDVALDFSHTYPYVQNVEITPAIGFGYRYWQRKLSASQIEEYTWYSVRPSLMVSYLYKNLKLSAKFAYQYGIQPKMRATGIADDFKLGSANIVEFSIPLEYSLSRNFAFYVNYVYQYQEIKESNVVYDTAGNGYLEPYSEARNQYIKIGMTFKY